MQTKKQQRGWNKFPNLRPNITSDGEGEEEIHESFERNNRQEDEY